MKTGAAVLMRKHGEDVRVHGAIRADELMVQGDMDGELSGCA